MKKQPRIIIICEHNPDHKQHDPSLLRACKGTNLIECVKCYTLLEQGEV